MIRLRKRSRSDGNTGSAVDALAAAAKRIADAAPSPEMMDRIDHEMAVLSESSRKALAEAQRLIDLAAGESDPTRLQELFAQAEAQHRAALQAESGMRVLTAAMAGWAALLVSVKQAAVAEK